MFATLPIVAAPAPGRGRRHHRLPWTLMALLVPGCLFVVGLFLVQDQPRYQWLAHPADYPVEFWVMARSGFIATAAGALDWLYHRSGRTAIGAKEHFSELLALGAGGVPLFVLMAAASVLERPALLLIPVSVCVLFTAVLICYDEFVFHRKRCGVYETMLHRLLVFGNGVAWLAWMNWCFVRGA